VLGDDWFVAVNTVGIVTLGRSMELERRFGKFKVTGAGEADFEIAESRGASLTNLDEFGLPRDDSSLFASGAGAFAPLSNR